MGEREREREVPVGDSFSYFFYYLLSSWFFFQFTFFLGVSIFKLENKDWWACVLGWMKGRYVIVSESLGSSLGFVVLCVTAFKGCSVIIFIWRVNLRGKKNQSVNIQLTLTQFSYFPINKLRWKIVAVLILFEGEKVNFIYASIYTS